MHVCDGYHVVAGICAMYLNWEQISDTLFHGRSQEGVLQARLIRRRTGWMLELRILTNHWLQDPSVSDKPKVLQHRADRIIRNGATRWQRVSEGATDARADSLVRNA